MDDLGYSIEANLVSQAECDSLVETLSYEMHGHGRAGCRHLMSHPRIAALANDPRLLQLAKQSLGSGAVPFRATLFQKSAKANWLVVWHQDTALPLAFHQDSAEWGPWSKKAGILYAHAPGWALSRVVALRLHLDASTVENGPLRVIPASHRHGVLSDESVFETARHEEYVNCLVPRGGVLVMRPLLIHSSSKARTEAPRRVMHIEYADSLMPDKDTHLAIA